MIQVSNISNIKQLWEGCLITSIAHAIMVSYYPDLSYEHSWDLFNYNVNNSEGTRGTITFTHNYCVAAFRNEKSERLEKNEEAINYFNNSLESIIEIAQNETLQYLFDEKNGIVKPIITTSFWCDDKGLYSNDNQSDMFENGAGVVINQIKGYDEALKYIVEYYDMTKEQVKLLKESYNLKMSNIENKVLLPKSKLKLIGKSNITDLQESIISFSEMDIFFE